MRFMSERVFLVVVSLVILFYVFFVFGDFYIFLLVWFELVIFLVKNY